LRVGSWKGVEEEGFGDETGEGEVEPLVESCSNLARIEDTELAGEFSGSILNGSDESDLVVESAKEEDQQPMTELRW